VRLSIPQEELMPAPTPQTARNLTPSKGEGIAVHPRPLERRPVASWSPASAAAGVAKRTAPARAPRSDEDEAFEDSTALSSYFREMSSLRVMTPEEEQRSAFRILQLKQDAWKAVLSYPPAVEAVCNLTEAKLEGTQLPKAALAEASAAVVALRRRDLRKNKDRLDKACAALALAMADVDTDSIVPDVVRADLDAILAGRREAVVLDMVLPRKGSVPFAHYAQRVRGAHAALWAAKSAFVKANLRLVVSLARRYRHGRMSLSDLVQEGNIGLMKAVDRYDPRRGYRFSTYASWWIRHAVNRGIADKGREVRIPVHMLDLQHKLNRTRREFENKHGRLPTEDELAAETGVILEKIERMSSYLLEHPTSLDAPISSEDGRTVMDTIADEDTEAPGERLTVEALGLGVRDALEALRPMEVDILRKRFGLDDEEPMTLKEIGQQYALSRERIRQLQERALEKVRDELARREILPR
jgi:RNA polymerase primary sigma factor